MPGDTYLSASRNQFIATRYIATYFLVSFLDWFRHVRCLFQVEYGSEHVYRVRNANTLWNSNAVIVIPSGNGRNPLED